MEKKSKDENTKKVTMQEIAAMLGVSRNTVFKALNSKDGVSESLRKKILEKAGEMGYKASSAQKQKNIVILVRKELFADQTYFAKIFLGIEENLPKGYRMSFTIVDQNGQEPFELSRYITTKDTEGVIIAGKMDSRIIKAIHQEKIPLVIIDHCDEDIVTDSVVMMNRKGVHDVVALLKQNGHKEIGFIGNVQMYLSFQERFDAFLREMERQQLQLDPRNIYVSGDMPFWDLKHLRLTLDPVVHFPQAFVCVNDRTAIALLKYLNERGIPAPEKVSVVGFDNTDESKMCIPSLTTVNVPKEYMGKKALETLLWRLQNPNDPCLRIDVAVDLKIRKSVTIQKE